MSELKPCPDCQSEKVTRAIYDTSEGLYIAALCRHCGARGPMYQYGEMGMVMARESWNSATESFSKRCLIKKGVQP